MIYELPLLAYANDALSPVISAETIAFHYGKHFKAYVDNLNKLSVGTEFEGKSVEEIVATAPDGPIYNNAGQVLNHRLYFEQFKAAGQEPAEPTGKLAEMIARDFGSFAQFKQEFSAAAAGIFGSGWAFLSCDAEGKLSIGKESNAGNPLRSGKTPLLTFDVWEHAYYLDYQNRRADQIAALWSIIDWDIVAGRLPSGI